MDSERRGIIKFFKHFTWIFFINKSREGYFASSRLYEIIFSDWKFSAFSRDG